MSDRSHDPADVRGPVMLCATRIMRPGPARIGRLFGQVSLPRTVELPTLIAGGVGAVVGFLLGSIVGGLQAGAYGLVFGAGAGWAAVNASPLEGESLARWLGLTLRSSHHTMTFRGEKVQASIGVCPIPPVHAGPVRIRAGAVNVPSHQYDRRGVRITVANRNVDDAPAGHRWVPSGRGGIGGFAVGGDVPPSPADRTFERSLDDPQVPPRGSATSVPSEDGHTPDGQDPGDGRPRRRVKRDRPDLPAELPRIDGGSSRRG